MDEHVIVWDLETVPDLAAVARIHGLPVTETALIREALGEKFPKAILHPVICIGALIARRAPGPSPWEVIALGTPHIGERTEAELIAAFVARIAELQPRLVTFNGTGFDLPVLRYRAMLHRISAPGLACRPYFHRYRDDAVDLCDVLSSFGKAGAKLHEISRMLGFAGKASGIDGGQVEQLVAQGRIVEVAAYCQEDVVNTYRIWLLHELFCGRLSMREYEASEEIMCRRGLTDGTLARPGADVVAELADALT
jgi:predicted PolB exonuclease-like 3'-5' exonuclease